MNRRFLAGVWWLTLTAASAQAQDAESAPPTAAEVALASPAAEAEITPDMSLSMSADELAALGIDASAPAVDSALRFNGFADVGFGTFIGPRDSYWRSSGVVPGHSSFFVGNLNLYAYKQLTETLRMMVEIRFTYLPNGSGAFGFEARQSTDAFDYTDYGRVTRWGSIIMQRAYAEWTPHALFTVRAGQFLTPYGVWNVDHGSPVFIPVRRPWSIGVGWIPEKQTGIELFGRANLSASSTLGYHLTLSNGSGPISEYADLDENKAVGGRLYWELRGQDIGWARLGVSGYYGRDTDGQYQIKLKADDSFASLETIHSQFDSLTFAGDFTWDLGGLHVQTELIVNQRAYSEKGRAVRQTLAGRAVVPSDILSWGGYAIIGYRFSWLGIMPFVQGERAIGDLEYLKLKLWEFQVGLNIRPVNMFVLKACFEHVVFQGDTRVDPNDSIMTQAAWAF